MAGMHVTLKNGFNVRRMLDVGNGWVDAQDIVAIVDVHPLDRKKWVRDFDDPCTDLLTFIQMDRGSAVGSPLPRRVLWRRYLKAMQEPAP